MKVISKHVFLIIVALWLCNDLTGQVIGDYDKVQRATDSLIVDKDFMKSDDTIIYLTDVTYHQFSYDSVSWYKMPTDTDKWMRVSSNAKNNWKVLDIGGLSRYWLNSGDYIYNNSAFGDQVYINTALTGDYDLSAGGDINTFGYYFVDGDSITHKNLFNGGATDGWVLVASGDTAIWQSAASGQGETNLMSNVNTRGVGVYDNKKDTLFEMRGVASLTSLLTVSLAAEDSTIDLDLNLNSISAGVGLIGGGSMENNVSLNFNIPSGFPTSPSGTIANDDWIVLYDLDSATHYKVHPDELVASSSAVDLYSNDTLRESSITKINIVEGEGIDVEYDGDGTITISSTPPPYTHVPDAYIAMSNSLYSYDISEGTALLLSDAPTSNWNTNTSFAEEDYIWTTSGTTLFRYDIANDTTESVTAGDAEIKWLINASDAVYAMSNGEAYRISKTSLSTAYYGSTVTNSSDITSVGTVTSGDDYLLLYNDVTDRFYWKKILTDHAGFPNDDWTAGTCNLGSDNHSGFSEVVGAGYWFIFDENNVTKVIEGTDYLTTGSCLTYRSDFKTYLVPSGRNFTEGGGDAITTIEASNVYTLSSTPVAYTIVSTSASDPYTSAMATLDKGIYVSKSSSLEYTADYTYEQAVGSASVYDMHVQTIQDGLNYTANVFVGGAGSTYFHDSVNDEKQFVTTDVIIVDNSLTVGTDVDLDVTFVYYDSNYTE